MAINFHIDSGSGKTKSSKVNSAQASTRAQQTKQALVGQSQASDSGNVAVKSGGILGKVGKYLPAVAEVASNFLPGAAGNIVKGLANAFNDPEWWQSVPGDPCTSNQPLRLLAGETEDIGLYGGAPRYSWKHTRFRPAIAEFVSLRDDADPSLAVPNALPLFNPTETAITQYLMPEIRKVVNAVPLQSAADYKEVIVANTTLYAIWRTLKKYLYMLQHGQTYLPNMNEDTFPILQVENQTKLMALINRLEEYLRSNVRLPHTLCEYLAWRFGRVYKSTQSAKAGLIMYNAYSINLPVATLESYVNALMAVPSKSKELQAANSDLYNAYFDHDLMVEIRDDTQFVYDAKEFALRTNCDIVAEYGDSVTIPDFKAKINDNPNPVFIDSALDNPTVFMASVVSTISQGQNTQSAGAYEDVLFPVELLNAYVAHDKASNEALMVPTFKPKNSDYSPEQAAYTILPSGYAQGDFRTWSKLEYLRMNIAGRTEDDTFVKAHYANVCRALANLIWMKPLDIYNKDVYLYTYKGSASTSDPNDPHPTERVGYFDFSDFTPKIVDNIIQGCAIDLTSLSYDMASVTDDTITVEHVYAFANLVHAGRKTGTSYAAAEKMVARDTANMIDKLDVAAISTK